jgi:membrane protein
VSEPEPTESKQNFVQSVLAKIDNYQQGSPFFGFFYAIIKKYGTDNGSYLAALITYYGVLSLFPLLIVFSTVTQLLLRNDAALRLKVSDSVSQYIPVIGSQLQHSIHSPTKTGIGLIISLLVTFYGARGGASVIQFSISSLWYVPQDKQPPFLKNIARSFGIIVGGGLGLIAATVISGYTTFLGHSLLVRLLTSLISCIVLCLTLLIVIQLSLPDHKPWKQLALSAGIAAIGLQILQILGSVVLSRELKSFNTTYGTFALVIGLMFWIYLQAEVILYAAEVDVVRRYKLWPRSLQNPLTKADQHAFRRAAKAQSRHDSENIAVHFD